ncbi:hypothetical protein L1987_24061 [Smallanthus sonchifolius]|uniref:Uncharacterized protein n=1 Tax=Smallanthus sonchifolius TaxID=185202 RepID=A0ACB9IIL7_9ASTR|nr:hypothetical protein L1987_24061 [Smallanthus sonchifolius]
MARRVEYKHNQVALLDPNMSEAVNFQGIVNFQNRSRLHVALSANPYISLPYLQQFWDTVHQDTNVEPHVLRATVNNTEVAISVETIRAALALGGAVDDTMSYPGTLIMGCFQRMVYRGRPNDTQAKKGVPAQQQQEVPIPQEQVHIPVNEPVQEEIAQDNNQDLGMNMDDFDHEAVNSPIHGAEGNVVDTSSGDTILPDSETTDTDSSRDFSSDHYARLATLPLANVGKRIKSKARKSRRKSVRNPPSGSVLSKRTLIDESSDSDSDAIPVPKAQKLMSASIAAAHSSQGVEDANFVVSLLITPPASKHTSPVLSPHVPHTSEAGPSKSSNSERITFLESQVLALQTQVDTLVSTDFQRQLVLQAQTTQIADMKLLVSKLFERLDAQGELRIHDTCHAESIQRKDNDDNDPSGNVEGDHQYADVNPISKALGESTSHTIEGTKHDSAVNEEVLLLEFFQDSEEEAEKLECLDDIDELFDDDEEDVLDNEVEEGEIVEIEIEKSKSKVTYEGSDGLNVPYNFIQDDVIPEFSYDGVTDSMDSVEDITTPDDTAQSKIDSDVDTTYIVSPKLNEEPVISDGVQYLKPKIKYFNTLLRCEMNGLATKPLINRYKCGLADVIANFIKREGGSGKYERLKPQKGKRVKIVDQKTKNVTWKYKFKPVRAVQKIPLKKIQQDFLGNMKWWYVDVNTCEARIDDKDNKVIVSLYDAMNLINFSKKDLLTWGFRSRDSNETEGTRIYQICIRIECGRPKLMLTMTGSISGDLCCDSGQVDAYRSFRVIRLSSAEGSVIELTKKLIEFDVQKRVVDGYAIIG